MMSSSTTIPVDILDDLSSRFLVNLPEEEWSDPIRLFFQIELAHWFYLDFYRSDNAQLKQCGMKEFTKHIFRHIPYFTPMLADLDSYYEQWKEYKMSVPTYGAIILNEDMTKVLLVQSFYEKTSWGFPKGKVNEKEEPDKCAVREVLEETGFDISKLIKEDEYIESVVCEQTVRLYIIHGIKETEKFHPKTRNEIKCVEWFTINDLPTNKKDITPKLKIGFRTNSFFMILPFMRRIKSWIHEKRGENSQQSINKKRTRHKSVGDLQPSSNNNGHSKNSKRVPPTNNEMKVDIQNLKLSAQTISPVKQAKVVKETKIQSQTFYRRQLFDEIHASPSQKERKSSTNCHLNEKFQELDFVIPCWLNFRLDRAALIKCFDI